MPKVNLLPKQGMDQKPLGKFLQWALSYGRYIIISVELIVFMVFFSRFVYDRQLQDLNDKIEQKEAIVQSAQAFEQEFRALQDKILLIQALDNDRLVYIELIEQLKRITPQNVFYTEISFNEDTITLGGKANDNASFAQLLASVKAEKFVKISLDSLEKQEGSDVVNFSMNIEHKNNALLEDSANSTSND